MTMHPLIAKATTPEVLFARHARHADRARCAARDGDTPAARSEAREARFNWAAYCVAKECPEFVARVETPMAAE